MRIGILANKEGWHYRQLAEAFAGRGIEVENYHITDIVVKVGMSSNSFAAGSFVGDKRLEELDALIVRSIPAGSLEQIVFRMNALHCLEQAGVFVMNPPSVIEKTVDKFYTSSLLEAYGVPTPPTMVTENRGAAMEAFFELGGDVVVKPLFGSLGKGMVRVDNPDVAYRVFSALEMNHYVFYLQKFISHENRDIRAFVLGDKVLSAMERRGTNWKTNIAQGAVGCPIELNDRQEQSALEAAKAIGCPYAGVDLICSGDGEEFVLEVNGVPGWEGLQKVSSVDIAGEIADFVLKGRGRLLITAEEVARAFALSSIAEVMAPKPGNVTRYQDFHDTTCEDFLISAWAAVPVFAKADKLAVGDLVLRARRASSQYVKSNTNLGIILLLAPLAKAALDPTPAPLRRRLHNVLKTLTVDDCRKAYTAIRETEPGGIGKLDKHDVRDEPAITLLEAMDLAKDRDSVALEYSSDYRITFTLGYPALLKAREESRCWTDAVVQAHLTVLADVPDTLIARKLGREKAKEVSIMAKETLDAGRPGSEDWKKAQANLDSYLREDHNHLNPGTTADLITASLFVLFIEKGYEEFLSEDVAAWQE